MALAPSRKHWPSQTRPPGEEPCKEDSDAVDDVICREIHRVTQAHLGYGRARRNFRAGLRRLDAFEDRDAIEVAHATTRSGFERRDPAAISQRLPPNLARYICMQSQVVASQASRLR